MTATVERANHSLYTPYDIPAYDIYIYISSAEYVRGAHRGGEWGRQLAV